VAELLSDNRRPLSELVPVPPDKAKPTLLVVEDDPAMLVALRDILEGAGYAVSTAANGQAALELLTGESPALILSDISMPVMDGIELFESVRRRPSGAAIPFIFLTARGTREDIFAGKSLGADDYITKPITSQELLAAVHARLVRAEELMLAQLKVAYKRSLLVMANAIEARDHYTFDHVDRVNAYAQALARELGWDDDRREGLEFGAILHDIGKIGVRESILSKTGPLTTDEWGEMREHPIVGARMIQGISYLAPSIPVVLYHHERWDGSGYPEGRAGDEIPEEARLLTVVDTFDAMTTNRPYRPAFPLDTAYEEILDQAGRQFDPMMVAAFERLWVSGAIHRLMSDWRARQQAAPEARAPA
jgi:putative two-component system response regulator